MKTPLIFLIFAMLLGCNGSVANDQSAAAGETLRLAHRDTVLVIYHQDMETSDTCPKVELMDRQDALIDTTNLCKLNIDGYRPFDARNDFAFIRYDNYRIENTALHYDVDLALLQGSAFVAECQVSIAGPKLGSPSCRRQGEP